MRTNEILTTITERFSHLLEPELMEEMARVGAYSKLPPGELIMDVGQRISHMPLLLSGSVRINREDPDGREIFLYHLEQTDTCAMSINCCIGNAKSEIRATTEEETEIIMIPVEYIDPWLAQYKSWRAFVFDSFNTRLNEMLEAIDGIAFMRLDERLMKYLRDKAKVQGSTELQTTHQDIASDLNTSRVVVSRLLKELERAGKLKLGRNRLKIIDL